MSVFTSKGYDQHEAVLFFNDVKTGLKAIIAVHDTTLGPSLGGTRMWSYHNDDQALEDVLRLSRGMTYKSALAGLKLGGGKAVIIGDAHKDKSEALFHAFGRAVDSLGGQYIAAEDVGIGVDDLEIARQETPYISGISEGNVGNPSPATAWGVFNGLKAAVKHRLDRKDLTGIKVAVQGLGQVGFGLCTQLKEAGAELVVADIYDQSLNRAVQELGATAVSIEQILSADVDVFAPCALGAILNDKTIPHLKAKIVAGAANNQLAEARHGEMLRGRNILYAPDYAINAGGIIILSHEGANFKREAAMNQVTGIHDTLLQIFKRADQEGRPTAEIADRIALERLEQARVKKLTITENIKLTG